MQIQLTLNTWSGGISLLVNKLSIENRAFAITRYWLSLATEAFWHIAEIN